VTALDDFLAPDEADAWIAYGETVGFDIAKHPQSAGIAHRDCGRLVVDSEDIAGAIFARLKPFLPPTMASCGGGTAWEVDACASNLRLYKYGRGQRFGKHYDGSNEVDAERRTFFTVLLYLNGGDAAGRNPKVLEGGHTNFFLEDGKMPVCSMSPTAGAVLIHEHGDRCLLHEGAAVLAGVKYLLRTDVIYRRSGKKGSNKHR